MGWSSLVRGTIRCGRRVETLNLNLNGGARSVSSSSSDSSCSRIKYVHDRSLYFEAEETSRFVNLAVRCENQTGIVFKCLETILHHGVFTDYSLETRFKVLSSAFHHIRNYPQADPVEVFLMELYIKSMCTDDIKKDITREEIASKLFDLINRYLRVRNNKVRWETRCDVNLVSDAAIDTLDRYPKVTEETSFNDDLMFDDLDRDLLVRAIYLEFKSPIRVYYDVKYTIDAIYKTPITREDLEEFREDNKLGQIFWPVSI